MEELIEFAKSKGIVLTPVPQEARGKVQIAYDVESAPKGISMMEIIEFYNNTGFLIYSSKNEYSTTPNNPPQLLSEKFKIDLKTDKKDR